MTFTLVADGSSDEVLMPILTWSLRRHNVTRISPQWADFNRLPRQQGLAGRLAIALDAYPCDLLFVHRDAESQHPDLRRQEIATAVAGKAVRHVAVVPVRMAEAWLMADERAIRAAAGNPNGQESLELPELRKLEQVPDPKQGLYAALVRASGLNIRRRSRLGVRQRVHLIPNHIDDYSPLLVLPAFSCLQEDIRQFVTNCL